MLDIYHTVDYYDTNTDRNKNTYTEKEKRQKKKWHSPHRWTIHPQASHRVSEPPPDIIIIIIIVIMIDHPHYDDDHTNNLRAHEVWGPYPSSVHTLLALVNSTRQLNMMIMNMMIGMMMTMMIMMMKMTRS